MQVQLLNHLYVLCLLYLYYVYTNVDGSSPNGSLLCRMYPSRTELFVYFFKLIPVYYYEYARVCEKVDSVCMSDWWGDCGGGFTSTREDVNGVEYHVVGSGRVSRNTHVCIRSYHSFVLTTINDQVLLEMKLCLVINCLITSLCSKSMIDRIDLKVEDINPLSDHCTVTTNISLSIPAVHSRNIPDIDYTCTSHTHIPYRWKPNFRKEYETKIESI